MDDRTTIANLERRLAESEARYGLLIGSWAQAVWETDPRGVVVADSPSWRAYTGQTHEEWLGHGWLDAIHPDDRAYAERQWQDAITARALVNAEFRLRAPNGGWRWTNVRAAPMLDDDGNIVKWAGMNIDIDARRRAEAASYESDARQRALIEGIPQLVWRAFDGGHWTWASPQWTSYTGQAEQDSHGLGWLDTVHPDDRDGALAVWAGAVERGEFHAEYRLYNAVDDRYCWFQTRTTPLRNERGEVVEWLGTSTDIDDLRTMQDRQRVLSGELQHRTRNLMGVVRAVFEDTLEASDDLDTFAVEIRDRLDALVRVQGLLSRLNSDERVTFDALIRDEMLAMGAQPDGGKVTLDGPSGVALRSSTVQTFALAIHELATNAVKYGALKQPTGRLVVTWRLAPAGPDERSWLHVDWRETGVAMPLAGTAPQGTGQGRQLIEHALPYQLSAITTYVMAADGVRCTIAVPVSSRTAAEETDDGRILPP